jgi:predicted RNase H-like HicB family nuclease
MEYEVVIAQDEDGVFAAEVPALPGCISQGYVTEYLNQHPKISAAWLLYLQHQVPKTGQPVVIND